MIDLSVPKSLKAQLFAWTYGFNLFFATLLWLCGQSGDIFFGILFIVFYRASLWLTPFIVTILCWFPSKPKISIQRKLISNLVLLVLSGLLFVLCFHLFGNWY